MKSHPPSTLAAAEQRIAALITPELEARALSELGACLEAETFVRSARGPNGIEYRSVPDRAIRLAASVKIIEFSRGRPGSTLTMIAPHENGPAVPARADLLSLLTQNPDLVHRIIDAHVLAAKQAVPSAQEQ